MRLARAASYFNSTPCFDGYTGKPVFKGQFALYDDTKRDAEVGERRVLSLDPQDEIPPRRVIEANRVRYIIGHGTPDFYRGHAIRVGYVAHEAPFAVNVRTLGQACTGQAGTIAWGALFRVKSLAFTEHNSKLPDQVHVHLAMGEAFPADALISAGPQHFILRSHDTGPAGTQVLLCDELTGTVFQTATFDGATYDPVTEALGGAPVVLTVIRIRWQSLFEYQTGGAPTFQPGEEQFAIAKSVATPRPGSTLAMPDGTWKVSAILDRGDAWICRASKHD